MSLTYKPGGSPSLYVFMRSLTYKKRKQAYHLLHVVAEATVPQHDERPAGESDVYVGNLSAAAAEKRNVHCG